MTHILDIEYGIIFELAYVISYMLVAMGIFNVTLAVYETWLFLAAALVFSSELPMPLC